MKDNRSIAAAQAAAHTVSGLSLTPLAAFQENRIAQVMDDLALPAGGLGDDALDLYEQVRDAVQAAYHAGWMDSRLRLGEL